MALIINNSRVLGGIRCRWNGANSNRYEDIIVRQNIYSNSTIDKKSGIPSGTKVPGSYLLPIMDGGLSSFTLLNASIGTEASLKAGVNLVATLSASITLTTAEIGLIIDLLASLAASGDITTAQMGAIANLTSSIQASGAITTADLGAIITIAASLSASGSFTTAFSTSLANMSAFIGGPPELSPEALAVAVWDYLKSNPTIEGSMKDVLEKAKQSADNAFAVSS